MQTLAAYRDDPNYLASITDANLLNESVRQLHALLVEAPCASFYDCIRWAAQQFHSLFSTEIRNIIHQFPVTRNVGV